MTNDAFEDLRATIPGRLGLGVLTASETGTQFQNSPARLARRAYYQVGTGGSVRSTNASESDD